MAPIESRTPDWRMGFGLQTARTGLRYRNPVIERTATSRVSKSFRGDLQLGKVAMPRGPRSEKRPADVIGAGCPEIGITYNSTSDNQTCRIATSNYNKKESQHTQP